MLMLRRVIARLGALVVVVLAKKRCQKAAEVEGNHISKQVVDKHGMEREVVVVVVARN